MTATKRQELIWLKNELANNEQFWESLHEHKIKEYGGSKDVFIFEHHVLKVETEPSCEYSQLLNEIRIWKTAPKYIKQHLCKIQAYGISNKKNYSDLTKTRKYNLFGENFLIMDRLNTNTVDIKKFLFPDIKRTSFCINTKLDAFYNCCLENIEYKKSKELERLRKDFSRFIMSTKYSDDKKDWLEDLICANIALNDKESRIQIIDYGFGR